MYYILFLFTAVALFTFQAKADGDFGAPFDDTHFSAFNDGGVSDSSDLFNTLSVRDLLAIEPAAGDEGSDLGFDGYTRIRPNDDAVFTRRIRGSENRIERFQAEPIGTRQNPNLSAN